MSCKTKEVGSNHQLRNDLVRELISLHFDIKVFQTGYGCYFVSYLFASYLQVLDSQKGTLAILKRLFKFLLP